MKEAKYINPVLAWLHSYNFLGKVKLEIRPVSARNWGSGKGTECGGTRNIWEDGNVLCLDCGRSCRIIYICQNSSNCTVRMVHYDICKLKPNQPDFSQKAIMNFLYTSNLHLNFKTSNIIQSPQTRSLKTLAHELNLRHHLF